MPATEVVLGPMAKGGACVARLDGRVVFVAGGIPGERVSVEVTDASRDAWWRGRVIEVIEASSDRVTPPCPVAGRCGGCDWQHIAPGRQRALKAELVAEQLRRLASVDFPTIVEPVPGDADGLAWRTRMRYLAQGDAVGLRAARSHEVVPLPPDGCPLAAPGGPSPDGMRELAGGDGEIAVTVAASGVTVWRPGGGVVQGEAVVTERAAGRDFRVRADGFWQVHPGAADALTSAVVDGLAPQPGEVVLDLYSGVGLFAGALASPVEQARQRRGVETSGPVETAGKQGDVKAVTGIEQSTSAVALARRNVPEAAFRAGRVEAMIGASGPADVVVLDPPRSGAGRAVVEAVATVGARAVAYVACDEASLARDLATFAAHGYHLASMRAFDIFPMTSYVESVAVLYR